MMVKQNARKALSISTGPHAGCLMRRVNVIRGLVAKLNSEIVPESGPEPLDGRGVRLERVIQDPNPIGPSLRLRLDKRRGEETDADAGDECASVHQWITSSARRRSDGGIVSPRALAVLRL